MDKIPEISLEDLEEILDWKDKNGLMISKITPAFDKLMKPKSRKNKDSKAKKI